MPDISSVFRHIFGCVCVYIFIYIMIMQLILVLQVAACLFLCLFVCFFIFVSAFGWKWIESAKSYNFDIKLWFNHNSIWTATITTLTYPGFRFHSHSPPGLWDGKGGWWIGGYSIPILPQAFGMARESSELGLTSTYYSSPGLWDGKGE